MDMMKEKHIIVISEDAMVFEDIQTLASLPNFGSVLPKAAVVEKVRTVYPSVTYPCHTSMRTGVTCGKHGITNNEKPILNELKSEWEWYNDAVKVRDIFDAAHDAGMTSGAIIWPVTCRHKSIDYLVNWPPFNGPFNEELLLDSGCSPETISEIIKPNIHMLDGMKRSSPMLEDFEHCCAADIIRKFKPNLLMLHPANVDHARHVSGVFSPVVDQALAQVDAWLGWILLAVREAGIEDSTDIFVVSDHGQINISRVIALNAVLASHGLIDVDENGNVKDYVAMSKSSGASAHIYMKNPDNSAELERVYGVLQSLREDGVFGIDRVYTAQEARDEEGLYGGFSFVVETDGYTSFSNDWKRPFVRNIDPSDYKFGRGTHGHNPGKGPQPTLIAFGPDIKPGVRVARKPIIDEAPTYAKILGISLPDADGKPIDEILI